MLISRLSAAFFTLEFRRFRADVNSFCGGGTRLG
jgi:hypothetical protein